MESKVRVVRKKGRVRSPEPNTFLYFAKPPPLRKLLVDYRNGVNTFDTKEHKVGRPTVTRSDKQR